MIITSHLQWREWNIPIHHANFGNKSLIIFLHGASYPAHCMMLSCIDEKRGIDIFNDVRCDTVFFNFPGFGDSETCHPQPFNNMDAVSILMDVFNKFEELYDNIFICGLSHGGMLAFLFAQSFSHPKLKGIIQFEPRVTQGPQFDGIDTSPFYRIIKNRSEIITLWEKQRIDANGDVDIHVSQNKFTSIGEQLERDPILSESGSFKVGMWATQMSDVDYSKIKIPVLWLYTYAQSGIFQPSHHLKLSSVLRTHLWIELVYIPKATHWFFAERHGRTIAQQYVEQFIQKIK